MTEEVPRTRLTDRKRAAILEAAVNEFRSRGFDNTSMDAIAAAAEVSKRTVYNHFPSKEDLFAAIVQQLVSRCDAVSEYPYGAEETLESQLTRIGQSVMEMFASDDFRNLAKVILSRFLQAPQLARTMTGESRRPEAGIADWIQVAEEAGRLNVQDSKQAARQFMGLLNSFAFWPQIVGSEPPLSKRRQDEIVSSAVAMFLSRYAA